MPQMMKALVKRKPEQGIWMEEVPVPEVGPNEVLIKLEKTAICGTDLHIYKWDEWSQRTIKPGLTIGHEFVGRIVEIGPGVTGYKIGDRVSAEGHIVCGHCRNCRAGRQHLCHEPTSVGLPETVGVGKGTVTLDDFDLADTFLIFGQNPATNHPRMMGELRECAKRGATIVSINPLRERGLERFSSPQHPSDMLSRAGTTISTSQCWFM